MPKTCLNCDLEFPYKVEIEGKVRNLQNRKYCLECSPFGDHNTKQLHSSIGNIIPAEKECVRCAEIKPAHCFYLRSSDRNKLRSYCKSCTTDIVRFRQREYKQSCVEYGGGSCQICGYKKCLSALTFHHLDPTEKEFNISRKHNCSATLSEPIKNELDKCILLCFNCHQEEHEKISGWLDEDPVFSGE